MNNLPARPRYNCTEDDWIQIRAHFMSSILVEVHLNKLAQNIGMSWPLKEADETAAKYLEFSFDELSDAPGIDGNPARKQLLLDILRETAAFDDPFQDMMEGKPDPVEHNIQADQLLAKMNIPPGFPIDFTALSNELRDLCKDEGANTIGQAVSLLQRMAQTVHLSGEVRQLLNSLAQSDLKGTARFFPCRPGSDGLHVPEALRILILQLPVSDLEILLSPTQTTRRDALDDQILEKLPALLEWFPGKTTNLKDFVFTGRSLDRFFHPLNDPAIETAAIRIMNRHFAPPTQTTVHQRKSLFSRMAAIFRRT